VPVAANIEGRRPQYESVGAADAVCALGIAAPDRRSSGRQVPAGRYARGGDLMGMYTKREGLLPHPVERGTDVSQRIDRGHTLVREPILN
jgi:hypothetical protein